MEEKQKKPVYKKWWFWLIVILVIGAIGSSMGEESDTTGKQVDKQVADSKESEAQEVTEETTEEATEEETTEEETEPTISYTKYQVSEMMDELSDNALKAEDKYNKQYVEITGELSVIDSGGKYVSLFSENEEFALTGVQCYIKNDTQKEQVMEMSKGDMVTIKGKITGVGEVLGYSLDIDEIVN